MKHSLLPYLLGSILILLSPLLVFEKTNKAMSLLHEELSLLRSSDFRLDLTALEDTSDLVDIKRWCALQTSDKVSEPAQESAQPVFSYIDSSRVEITLPDSNPSKELLALLERMIKNDSLNQTTTKMSFGFQEDEKSYVLSSEERVTLEGKDLFITRFGNGSSKNCEDLAEYNHVRVLGNASDKWAAGWIPENESNVGGNYCRRLLIVRQDSVITNEEIMVRISKRRTRNCRRDCVEKAFTIRPTTKVKKKN